MKRYKLNHTLFIAVVMLFSLIITSCTKEELVDPPKVLLTTDWTNHTEGVSIPSAYTVVINNQVITYNNISNTLPQLEAGTYPITVCNTADKITVEGTSAKVATSGNIVNAQPGYLFYSALDVEFENNKEKTVTAVMQQQVRLLNIELTITEGDINDVESITASFSGVANTMDLKTNTYSGTGLKVEPVFTKNGNKLIASVRLIGLTAETQKLTLDIKYKSGAKQQIVSDVSSLLTNFGTNKHQPLTLKGNAEVFTAIETQITIEAWDIQDIINDNTTIK